MIRRIALLVILAFFLSTNAQAVEMVSVNRPRVNLRSGPGEKHPVAWSLGQGYPLKVVGKKGLWLKVRDFEGDTGWIYRKLVDKTPHLVVKNEGSSLRRGPGKKQPVIGKAERGVVLKTIKRQGSWVRVRHEDGLTGWMERGHLWGW